MTDTPRTDKIAKGEWIKYETANHAHKTMETMNTPSPKNDQPTYAMLADMRDRALLAERERDEHRKLADDAMATLHEIKVKYGLGERHVMREKDREIEKLHKIIDEMEILASWPG
jgi:hypothetical protein